MANIQTTSAASGWHKINHRAHNPQIATRKSIDFQWRGFAAAAREAYQQVCFDDDRACIQSGNFKAHFLLNI
jgi:hypothetical protein